MTVRVLVVDDDPDMRLLLGFVLDRDGESTVVAEAQNGLEAIELARMHQPDVIVLDEAMPGMTGSDAVPGLREVAPGVRIVMYTAYGETGRRAQLEALADAVAVKGGSVNELVELVTTTDISG